MFTLEFETDVLKRRFTDYEKRLLPAITVTALNETMFAVRDGFKAEFANIFDRPTAFTLNSVLFKKATKDNLVAEVFIRDESKGGTPPVKYLYPEAAGGPRGQKAFEKRLQARYGKRYGSFYVPGRGVPLDAHGNVPRGLYARILSQLQAQGDRYNNETAKKRAARLRRQSKKGGGGSYFILQQKRGKLKPGVVYERVVSGHGTTVRTVLAPVKQPQYKVRLNVPALAQKLFNEYYPAAFKRWFDTYMAGVK